MNVVLNDNEFFGGLANLALILKLYATNTSDRPNNFVDSFATDTLAYGDSKLFPFTDLPAVDDYSATSSVLNVTTVDNTQEQISISQQKVIKSSYNTYILDMAMTGADGANQFVGYLLGQMDSARQAFMQPLIISDLYSGTVGTDYGGTGSTITINTANLATITGNTDLYSQRITNQKMIALGIQDTIQNMSIYSSVFNTHGFDTALSPDDLKLVIAEPYRNQAVIDLYASLLNSSQIDFNKPEMQAIPSMLVPSAQSSVIGWLMHKQAYQWFYKFMVMTNFFDASNLTINNFLHFWFGKGFVKGLPMAKLLNNAT